MPTSIRRLTDTLFATASRTPDAVALRVDDSACTYAELVDRVRRVAGGLAGAVVL